MANKQNQILKNQSTILLMLSEMDGTWNVDTLNSVSKRLIETDDALKQNPEVKG